MTIKLPRHYIMQMQRELKRAEEQLIKKQARVSELKDALKQIELGMTLTIRRKRREKKGSE